MADGTINIGVDLSEKELKSSLDYMISIMTIGSKTLSEVLSNSFSNALDNINITIININNLVKDLIDKVSTQLVNWCKSLPETIANLFNEIVTAFNKGKTEVITVFSDLLTTLLTNVKKSITDFYKSSENIVLSMRDGINTSTPNIITAIQELLSKLLTEISSKLPDIFSLGSNIVTEIISGVNSINTELFNTINKLMNNNVLTNIKNFFPNINSYGVEIISSLVSGISASGDLLLSSVNNIWNNISDFFLSVSLFDIGKNIMEGLKNGMLSYVQKIKDTVTDIGNTITVTIKDTLGIHSPSRVMKEIGEYTGDGLINGLKSKTKDIDTITKNISDRLTNINTSSHVLPTKLNTMDNFNPYQLISSQGLANNWDNENLKTLATTNNTKSNIFNVTIDANNLQEVDSVVDMFNNLEVAYNAF